MSFLFDHLLDLSTECLDWLRFFMWSFDNLLVGFDPSVGNLLDLQKLLLMSRPIFKYTPLPNHWLNFSHQRLDRRLANCRRFMTYQDSDTSIKAKDIINLWLWYSCQNLDRKMPKNSIGMDFSVFFLLRNFSLFVPIKVSSESFLNVDCSNASMFLWSFR